MKARWYLLAGSWIAGIALHGLVPLLWPLLLVLIPCLCAWSWKQHRLKLALACCGLGLAGFSWSHLRELQPAQRDPSRMAPLQNLELCGSVRSDLVQQGPDRWSLDLEANSIRLKDQDLQVSGVVRVQLKLRPESDLVPGMLRIGDQLQVRGNLDLPQPALNFGAFSYKDYLHQQGIFSVFYAYSQHKLSDGPAWLPARLLQTLRLSVLKGFEQHLPLGQAHLLGSLLVGSGASPVPDEIQQKFQAAGLQHVLAVSGFQVELVVLGVMALCQLLKLPRGLSFIVSLSLLWLFVALTGFPGSVLRAGVVASLGLVGYLRFRSLDALAGLVLGCCGLLLLTPWLLLDIGFQFSVLATLGLILMAPWLEDKLNWLPLPVSKAIAPMLAAQAWVLPAQLFHFGTFSWLFLPANLLAGLLTTALSWLAIAGALTGWLPALQNLVLIPAGWLVSGFLWGLDLLLRLPSPVLALPTLAPSLTLLAYTVLLLLKRWDAQPVRWVLLACLATAPLLSGALWYSEKQHCPVLVTFISVGQGDATLIETPDQVLLVDAGPRWERDGHFEDAGARDILPYLQRRGIHRIDTAIISHGHLDHYGGYFSLLEKINIGRFVTVSGPGDSPAYLALLQSIQQHQIPFETIHNGSFEILKGNLKLVFWQPLADPQASLNDQSLAVQLIHQNVKFLLSGDLEQAGEAALLATPGFEAAHTILKVPHHGSLTSSTPEFLQAVHPAEAIVSVGEHNKYHHPAPEIISRYQQLGIHTWRTDRNGAVCVCSQGNGYEIRTLVQQKSGLNSVSDPASHQESGERPDPADLLPQSAG